MSESLEPGTCQLPESQADHNHLSMTHHEPAIATARSYGVINVFASGIEPAALFESLHAKNALGFLIPLAPASGRFHDIRRSHATYNRGKVDDRELQKQMGHATFQTTPGYILNAEKVTQQTYDAFLPGALVETRDDVKTTCKCDAKRINFP